MDEGTTQQNHDFKAKDFIKGTGKSAFQKYREINYGDKSLGYVILCEIVITLFGWIPGALGLLLRRVTYRFMFQSIGHKVVFGRNVTIRHAHKIRLGNNVILDDHVVIDAKGNANIGITIGNNIYIGRNTIIYCKNGNITIEDDANISSNCQILSANSISVGHDTVIGAFSYLLSGGEYDYTDTEHTFAQQSGMNTKGELTIGADCWLSARVTVLDAASIGQRCVIGAGAVVVEPIPAKSLAVGVPAKVIKQLPG